MKRHEDNVDEILGKVLHSTPQQEMEAAGARVLRLLRTETPTPSRLPVRKPWRALVAAAAAVFAVIVSSVFWPAGSAAVVEAADNGLYRVVGGKVQPLRIGQKVEMGEIIRSDGDLSATLAIEDGSRIEMRSMSELALEDASDGLRIRLNGGSVIVSAVKESKWRLYVQTRDAKVSMVDTVSLVTAEEKGSRVAVLQGEAHVEQGGSSKWLRRGEQVATVPLLEQRSIAEGISWSRRAELLLPMLQQAAALVAPQTQPAGTPKWEVVSIRSCSPDSVPNVAGARGGGSRSFSVSPGRLSIECVNVQDMIRQAFVTNGEPLLNSAGLEREKLIRGPEWIYSSKPLDRYSIEAKAEGTPDRKTMLGPMLQALLETRFQLKSHRELEEISLYALTVAKGGLKIKPINEGDCTEDDHAMGPKWLDQVRRGEKGFCNFVFGQPVGPGTTGWAFGGHTLSDFASLISSRAGKHIVDQTGVPGRFRIYLEVADFALDGAARGLDAGQPPAGPLGPDIFTAVQEQLGLKLVDGGKGQHQFIVVDHVERPSEN